MKQTYNLSSTQLHPLKNMLYIVEPSTNKCLHVCKFCHNKLKEGLPPIYSKAAGFDFGDTPNELRDLHPIEKRMIAKYVPSIIVHRIRGSGNSAVASRGHAINFQHELAVQMVTHNIINLLNLYTSIIL